MSVPEMSVVVAARLLTRATRAVRRQLKLVRRDPRDVEFVHRLRVWSRRSVVALDFFAPLYPARRLKKLRQRLRHIRRMAGRVRDCDILLAKQPADDQRLRKQRRQASDELAPYSAKAYRKRLKRQVRQLLRRADDDSPPFTSFAQARLQAVAEAFWAADPPTLMDLHVVHQFRIRTKVLRYSLEFIAEACELSACDDLIAMVGQMQEALGDLNDAALYQQRLQDQLGDTFDPADVSELQRRIALAYADTLQKTEAFRVTWTDDARHQLRTHLATLHDELG